MLDTAKIRALRTEKGLSQRAAAELAGMGTAQAWSLLETGDSDNVTLKTLNKLAKALQVPAKDLLK